MIFIILLDNRPAGYPPSSESGGGMNAVGIGILYLVLGNMVAVFSDALVKVLEPDQPIFQFVFFRQLSFWPAARPLAALVLAAQPAGGPQVAPAAGPYLGRRCLPDGGRPHPAAARHRQRLFMPPRC